MIPLYLVEMQKLPESDPEIYQEFLDGNWVVNKNEDEAFCALGADNAHEQINRSMKVSRSSGYHRESKRQHKVFAHRS